MPPSSPGRICNLKKACYRENSKKGRTHGWHQEDVSNLAEVTAFTIKSSCEMKSWAWDFLGSTLLTFVILNGRGMDRIGT